MRIERIIKRRNLKQKNQMLKQEARLAAAAERDRLIRSAFHLSYTP